MVFVAISLKLKKDNKDSKNWKEWRRYFLTSGAFFILVAQIRVGLIWLHLHWISTAYTTSATTSDWGWSVLSLTGLSPNCDSSKDKRR